MEKSNQRKNKFRPTFCFVHFARWMVSSPSSYSVFGYGSLIFKPPPFPYTEKAGKTYGYVRRFAQNSHDHRGTPAAPGLVATLVKEEEWDRGSLFSSDLRLLLTQLRYQRMSRSNRRRTSVGVSYTRSRRRRAIQRPKFGNIWITARRMVSRSRRWMYTTALMESIKSSSEVYVTKVWQDGDRI